MLDLELVRRDVQDVDADALLVPVDGALCRLGGAAGAALRAALPTEERADELEFVGDALERLRPLPDGEARVIDGVARWRWLVVSAAYPHSKDGRIYTALECAQHLRGATARALATAVGSDVGAIAMTVIGTAYRIPGELAIRAQLDGLAAGRQLGIRVRWAFRDDALLDIARRIAGQLGWSTGAS